MGGLEESAMDGKSGNIRNLAYEKLIRELSRENTNRVIENSNPEHARVVISEILNRAINEVNIVTDRFDERFYRELEPRLLLFFEEGKKMRILTYSAERNSLLLRLKRLYPNQIEIRTIPDSIKEKLFIHDERNEKEGSYINFIIDDTSGVRYEVFENIGEDATLALVNFGDQEFHDILKRVFEDVWKEAGGTPQ